MKEEISKIIMEPLKSKIQKSITKGNYLPKDLQAGMYDVALVYACALQC